MCPVVEDLPPDGPDYPFAMRLEKPLLLRELTPRLMQVYLLVSVSDGRLFLRATC